MGKVRFCYDKIVMVLLVGFCYSFCSGDVVWWQWYSVLVEKLYFFCRVLMFNYVVDIVVIVVGFYGL